MGIGAAERARQQLAALLGDGAEQLLQEGNVHGNCRVLPILQSGPQPAKLTLNYNKFATLPFPSRGPDAHQCRATSPLR